MKNIILISALILSAFNSKATNFSLVIATTDSAYRDWYVAKNARDTVIAHITSLGARPVAPIYDSTNTNHSTFATAATTWDSSWNSLQTILTADIVTARTAELALLATIGYGTPYTNTPVNQWIMVQGGSFPTAWIGYLINTNYIVVTTVRPTRAFTN
jgi:hypothetical protein